jgi:hypothetical protein
MKKQRIQTYTPEQMAEYAGIKRRQLSYLVSDGYVPRFGSGREAVFTPSSMRFFEIYSWLRDDPRHDCAFRWRCELSAESDFVEEWTAFHGREPEKGEANLPYMQKRWAARRR